MKRSAMTVVGWRRQWIRFFSENGRKKKKKKKEEGRGRGRGESRHAYFKGRVDGKKKTRVGWWSNGWGRCGWMDR